MHRLTLFALAALAASAAAAQQAPAPDPADPRASAPPLEYRSAFSGYRRLGEEKVAPWRESNEAVTPGGGRPEEGAAPMRPQDESAPPPKPDAMQRGGRR